MRRWIPLIFFVVLGLAACNGGGQSSTGSSDNNPIQWDRNPNTIVFRADTMGGSIDDFIARNEIPPCTIYGDNRVVWTNELGAFNVQVLWDQVSDEQIRAFVNLMVVNMQIYNYESKANLEPPSGVTPVVETLVLAVNNDVHQTDAFSGWDFEYFQRIVGMCRAISQSPVLYEPGGAWISARTVAYDTNAPGMLWDAASGLNLAELASSGQPQWVTDNNARILWNALRTSSPNIQFTVGETQYQVALQVPNITRESPAAPG